MRAFPWSRLESVSRADVTAARRARAWLAQSVDLARASAALSELTGLPIAIDWRSARAHAPRRPDPGAIGVLFSESVLIDVEVALAVALVSAALKRPPTRLVDPARANTPHLAGALAALLVACARRAALDLPPRVITCGPTATLAISGERVVASFRVLVGDDVFLARVSIPAAALEGEPPFSLEGSAPLAIPLVADASAALPSELARLQVGDVWILGAPTIGLPLAGTVALCAPASELGAIAKLEDHRLVLSSESIALPWQPEELMTEGKDALVASLGEVPVIVRAEIGAAQMSAREWSRIGAGDVITLGKRVGEMVVLRVAGEEVARGELVDVEGEIGVRIAALSAR